MPDSSRPSLQSLLEAQPDPDAPDEQALADRIDTALVVDLWKRSVAELDTRARTCLKRRNLAADGSADDLAKLGRKFGLSVERVRQIAHAALITAARRCAERCAKRGIITPDAIEDTARRIAAAFPSPSTQGRKPRRTVGHGGKQPGGAT